MNPLDYLDSHARQFAAELKEFVAIPSVSTDPEHALDVKRASDWVAARLRRAGPIHVETWSTPRHPAVFGRWDAGPGAPTVLIYGHCDVQPPDPLSAWHSPPFELTERNGLWYGRGVSDDKASMLLPILAAEACFASHEPPPVNLRFLFEAEEEIGSPNLAPLVRDQRDALACDVVISADGGMWRADKPSLNLSMRGLAALAFTVKGPAQDLHSGRHGGAIANPVHAAAALVASLHDANGRILVSGFYDDVEPIEPAAADALARLPFSESDYIAGVGAPAPFGEAGFTTLARQWYRPTLEVNGFGGGYQGPGSKTVLPSEAHVKITCRLVPKQKPEVIAEQVRAHLERHCPASVRLTFEDGHHGAPPYRVSAHNPYVKAAASTLTDVFGATPDLVGMGGTVPVVTVFRDALGVDTVFFSFSVGDENIHGPNEFYRPDRFRLGPRAWIKLWREITRAPNSS
jgi:acetylornithine deacetylase/succinyl-diaminopimelate desuccinylase-like protein